MAIAGVLDEGAYATVSMIGDASSKNYVSRLALLAPDIVEAIIAGRSDQGMTPKQVERPLPASRRSNGTVLSSG